MYRLEGKTPVPVTAEDEAGQLSAFQNDRRVDSSRFRVWQRRTPKKGGYRKEPKRLSVWVSTVFLVVNHQWGDGPPILFETMVFFQSAVGKKSLLENETRRYHTWDEAAEGHKQICELVRRRHLKR